MNDELVLTDCPDPDCDMPAEVLDSYAEYHTAGGNIIGATRVTPLQRILHVRTRCLMGHILDRIQD